MLGILKRKQRPVLTAKVRECGLMADPTIHRRLNDGSPEGSPAFCGVKTDYDLPISEAGDWPAELYCLECLGG